MFDCPEYSLRVSLSDLIANWNVLPCGAVDYSVENGIVIEVVVLATAQPF